MKSCQRPSSPRRQARHASLSTSCACFVPVILEPQSQPLASVVRGTLLSYCTTVLQHDDSFVPILLENLTYRDASRIQGPEGGRGGGEGEERKRKGRGREREGEGKGGGCAAASASISIIFPRPAACRDRAAGEPETASRQSSRRSGHGFKRNCVVARARAGRAHIEKAELERASSPMR